MTDFDEDDEQTQAGMSRIFRGIKGTAQQTTSPLSRRIIAFNLVGLSLLVTGILFINQSSDSLSELRSKNLLADAELIAAAMEIEVSRSQNTDLTNTEMGLLMAALSPKINAKVLLFYDAEVLQFDQIGQFSPAPLHDEEGQRPRTNAVSDIFSDAWNRLSSVFVGNTNTSDGSFLSNNRSNLAMRSVVTSEIRTSTVTNEFQQVVVIIAAPIMYNGDSLGAVILSTIGGEIDGYIESDRNTILQLFALAIVVSMLLSAVLANTIGRPLRDLAHAAKRGSALRTGGFNPDRVKIPDLSDRGDEIGELSTQLRNMTSALYDRIEANETFTADVTHEIKNPLTSLASAAETMKIAKTEDAKARLLEVIIDDVKRMDRLVTDISNASRLDAELAKVDMEPIDLARMIRSLVEYHQPRAEEHKITVDAVLPEGELYILGLESRLAQVFVNLITNAISFVPKGGRVTTSLILTPKGNAKVIVEDTGCGIPKDNLEDVFKRFYSNRPTQDFGNNSGLGLAISKQIIEAHGGKIWAANIYPDGNEDGEPTGARFTVILPI